MPSRRLELRDGVDYPSASLCDNPHPTSRMDPKFDPRGSSTKRSVNNSELPELVGAEWIDQSPVKLSDLRGQVVLLALGDLVRTVSLTFQSCNSGMTVTKTRLGNTWIDKLFRRHRGRRATPKEELAYLKTFKKQNRCRMRL